MKKILYVVNSPSFFVSHRLDLAVAAREFGFDVHVATPLGNGLDAIEKSGIPHHVIGFSRSGRSLLSEVKVIISLLRLFMSLKPSVLHLVTIKPTIYGGFLSRFLKIKTVVSISGLGTVFIAKGLTSKIQRFFIMMLYRSAINHKYCEIIFQNRDDLRLFKKNLGLNDNRIYVVKGSGILLDRYPYVSEPSDDRLVVVMASRLIEDKGVSDFVEAAKYLERNGVLVEMRLIGELDPDNLTSIDKSKFENWLREKKVVLLGFREDIAIQYAQAHIVCLPSYREGLPRSLIEAAACGRAIITTDAPGCRDAIKPGISGLLVPVRDPEAIAQAIKFLADNPSVRKRMGLAGRQLAEHEFRFEKISRQHLKIYLGLA